MCGSEVHAFLGTHPFRKAPVILGHEMAGDVFAVGEAVILDLRGYGPGAGIPLEEVRRAAEKARGIKESDIALCMTGWSRYYKMLGIDTGGSMDPAFPDRWNHLPLFEAGLVYIENLTNLESVLQSRVTVAALTPAVEGLEGLPVRVVVLLWGESA